MTFNPVLLTLWLAELSAKWDRNGELDAEHFIFISRKWTTEEKSDRGKALSFPL
jgi:hypothetical protein